MDLLLDAIKGIFAGLAQGILSLFGMSDAQKLGRAEVQNDDLKTQLKTEKDALDVETKVAGMSDAAVDAELRDRWK